MSLKLRIKAVATADALRVGGLALAGLALTGTAVELATERHWNSFTQLVPWIAVALLVVALGLLLVRSGDTGVTAARTLAVLVLFASVYGVIEHVTANIDAGALDVVYSSRWDSMSGLTQLWYAATKTVGPSPPLAPGVLAQAALLILLTTWRYRGASAAPDLTRETAPNLAPVEIRLRGSSM